MNLSGNKFLNCCKFKKVVKVISGLNTFSFSKVFKILKSAEISKAGYLDVAANAKIISLLKKTSNFPLCVSSLDPIELYNCSISGAEILEIGNFDVFYKSGLSFSSFDILKLAIETRRLVPDKDVCVTIPYTLNLYEQVSVAKKLEKLGVRLLQTEGMSDSKNLSFLNRFDVISRLLYVSASTLSSTYVLSRAVNIPVVSSSKINFISSLTSIIFGAFGVGIKSLIYDKKTVYEMSCCIDEILHTINLSTKANYSITPTLLVGNPNKNLFQSKYK
uniref:Uncharacterized protein ycf23 n=1 Tax=Caloglossa intermedia TaxID=100879 RepID=A0A1Z1M6B5_9FLOR|nr:hypothetical protein [Caloglossa intermedia]ARW61403.1 hypothetical protein [Caloglossa intermedia]